MGSQMTLSSPSSPEKKNKLEDSTFRLQNLLPNYNNQNSVVLVQGRHTDHWNKTGNLKLSPHVFNQMIFNKGIKTIQLKRYYTSHLLNSSIFSKWFWENRMSTCKRMKLNFYLRIYTKITQNVRSKTIKILEENTGLNFTLLELGMISWI